MSKDAPQTDQARKAGGDDSPKNLAVWLKVFLSLLFAGHLLGVFIAPLYMSIDAAYSIHRPQMEQTPPAQEPGVIPASYNESEIVYLAQGGVGEELLAPVEPDSEPLSDRAEVEEEPLTLYELYVPYLNLLYLNHGYGFFSPDPGPSHLIRFRIEPHNGGEYEGIFPNLTSKDHPALKEGSEPETHWPRLRYHRHFMLAEQLIQPATESNEESSEDKPQVFSGKTYAAHLWRIHHAKRVHLDYIEHRLLTPEEARSGKPLDDPDSYEVLLTLTYPDDFPDVMKSLEGAVE